MLGLVDAAICRSVVTALSTSSQWLAAMKQWTIMQSQYMKPDAIAYQAMLDACSGASQWSTSLSTLAHMRFSQVAVDGVSLSAVLSSIIHAGRLDIAVAVYQEAIECHDISESFRIAEARAS